jgi:hypothetical protein
MMPTKKISNQPFVRFEVWMHAVPAQLAAAAAARRGMEAGQLIAEISSGVFVRGSIGKALEFYSDWRLTRRIREADSNYWKKRAHEANGFGPQARKV